MRESERGKSKITKKREQTKIVGWKLVALKALKGFFFSWLILCRRSRSLSPHQNPPLSHSNHSLSVSCILSPLTKIRGWTTFFPFYFIRKKKDANKIYKSPIVSIFFLFVFIVFNSEYIPYILFHSIWFFSYQPQTFFHSPLLFPDSPIFFNK